jgi:hydroxymethylbilane synthase
LGITSNVKFFAPISKDIMVPAMGQAALGIETSADFSDKVLFLNDAQSAAETKFERAFVDELQGGCQAPIGVNAELMPNGLLNVRVCLGMPDGSNMMRENYELEASEQTARELAREILAKGGDKLLADACAMGEIILKK